MNYTIQQALSWYIPQPQKPDAPLFIFLPGMDGSGRLYHRQTIKLSEYFDVRCLTLSPHEKSDWGHLVDQVIVLIKKELDQKSEPAYLCGESFGGCLALKIALKSPDLLQRLILVNPASCFNQRPLLSLGINLTQWMPDVLHRSSTLVLLPFIAALDRMSPNDRQALLKAMQSVPQSIVSWRLSLLQNCCFEPTALSRFTQPVLLIASHRDNLLPSVAAGRTLIKHFPNARMVTLPESGHTCLLESDIQLKDILKAYSFLPKTAVSQKVTLNNEK